MCSLYELTQGLVICLQVIKRCLGPASDNMGVMLHFADLLEVYPLIPTSLNHIQYGHSRSICGGGAYQQPQHTQTRQAKWPASRAPEKGLRGQLLLPGYGAKYLTKYDNWGSQGLLYHKGLAGSWHGCCTCQGLHAPVNATQPLPTGGNVLYNSKLYDNAAH
jgi:hypothetical protein